MGSMRFSRHRDAPGIDMLGGAVIGKTLAARKDPKNDNLGSIGCPDWPSQIIGKQATR